jgi:hypothetical protein
MRKAPEILGGMAMALAAVAGIYVYFANQSPPIVKIIGGITAKQVSATEWTLSCLACADIAKQICTDFTAVSEEIDYGSAWHTTIKCFN